MTAPKMDFHEAANIFPIDEEHIDELADDIRKNKQLVPIELLDGKVIDGRRRWLACLKAAATMAMRDRNAVHSKKNLKVVRDDKAKAS